MSPVCRLFTKGSQVTSELIKRPRSMMAPLLSDCHMHKIQRPIPNAPLNDYRDAVAGAIAWLGNRYLLAHPVNVTASMDELAHRLGSSACEGNTTMNLPASEGESRISGCHYEGDRKSLS